MIKTIELLPGVTLRCFQDDRFKQGILTEKIDAIFGSINGIEGIINDDLVNLKSMIRTNEDMELLRQTPSTMLGSCRYKLPSFEEKPEVYEKILACFERHRIRIFVYIGGNDSMDTVVKLSDFLAKEGSDIRVIGVPKTIDNDLPVTDHTPGFGWEYRQPKGSASVRESR